MPLTRLFKNVPQPEPLPAVQMKRGFDRITVPGTQGVPPSVATRSVQPEGASGIPSQRRVMNKTPVAMTAAVPSVVKRRTVQTYAPMPPGVTPRQGVGMLIAQSLEESEKK